nr:hypothetical protein Itr_chr04CG10490 [Ipomoea trifida]
MKKWKIKNKETGHACFFSLEMKTAKRSEASGFATPSADSFLHSREGSPRKEDPSMFTLRMDKVDEQNKVADALTNHGVNQLTD